MTESEQNENGIVTRRAEEIEALRPLRDRIADNPRPALVWLGVGVLLLVLEFGRVLSWLGAVLQAAEYLGSGFAHGPAWVGRNVAGTLGPEAGTVALVITGLLMVYVLVTLLTVLGIRWGIVSKLGVDVDQKREPQLDRIVVTVLLTALGGVLLITPIGAILRGEFNAMIAVLDLLSDTIPTITSPELISNEGHRTPEGGWEGTFLGLSPAVAWAIRVGIVLAYATALVWWVWNGYQRYREHYRQADWTPRDDTVRRLRKNSWGMFGLVVIILFVVLAVWAPAISPVPIEHNVYEPYEHETQYLDEETGEIESATHGIANLNSRSDGQNTVGPLSYDDYDRWAPLGTTDRGQDMMTHLAFGARTSLIIGLTAIGLAGTIAVVLSLMTAYYKGIADIATVIATDTIISIPALLLIMMIMVLFDQADHFLADPLDGGFLLAIVFGLVYWPGIWRSIRGPSLQVAEQEWIDAAKSYGQTPLQTMRKHMAPYIAGYVMIYGSLMIGGIIITTAALTFLGLGINAPTPEWGRLIDSGEPFIATSSYHVATVPGVSIALVVVGFNALGDGIRDAIDPEADVGDGGDAAAAGGGA